MTTKPAYPILSVEQAQERVLSFGQRLEPETVPILSACGRILAEDICASDDVPPYNNSAMDGFAVRGDDLKMASSLTFQVMGEVPAGSVWPGQVGRGQAVRIMTGAPLPQGADTVVRFEDTESDGESVRVLKAPRPGQNVRLAGEDIVQGQTVLRQSQRLRPQEVGMLASVGRPKVAVYRQPRVAILATGDEVIDLDTPASPGKIRNINSYTNAAQVQMAGGLPLVLPIAADRRQDLSERLSAALDLRADLIVTSGGVSVGDFDLVKQVLRSEGNIDFWWVNMKPGRPMAFGALEGVPLLALPGNPVAAMVSFWLFGVPMIKKMSGAPALDFAMTRARLAQPIARKDGRRHYLRVTLEPRNGALEATLTGDQGSGILMSMVQADGLAIIPEDRDHVDQGEWVEVLLFDYYGLVTEGDGHPC